MKEIPVLSAAQIRGRHQRFKRLVHALFANDEMQAWSCLGLSRVSYLYRTDLTLLEWASAVCGASMQARDGHRCNHYPDEYAANAMQCPESDPTRGECCECPF